MMEVGFINVRNPEERPSCTECGVRYESVMSIRIGPRHVPGQHGGVGIQLFLCHSCRAALIPMLAQERPNAEA